MKVQTIAVVYSLCGQYRCCGDDQTSVLTQKGVQMSIKLFDSELKVMDVLWKNGDMTAKKISDILKDEIGWNMNTTYTVIKKCIAKGAIQRNEPQFSCHALIDKSEVQKAEAEELVDKLFDGSPEILFASLLSSKKLSEEQLKRLYKIVEDGRKG